MYTLYYSPGTASMVVHLALLEIGAAHRLERVDLQQDASHRGDYLRLNPRGQVPTLVVDGKAYFESAALLMLLAERHPEAKLAPPVGSSLRADWYQWAAYFTNTLAPAYRFWFYPQDLGSIEHPEFSGVDLLALMYMRWSRNMPRPVTDWPALRPYADRLRQRPSWKRLYEIEGLTEWAA
jgi:glutathione S-transferase